MVDAGGWDVIVAALWRESDRGANFGKTTKEVFEIEVAAPQAQIQFECERISYCEEVCSAPS